MEEMIPCFHDEHGGEEVLLPNGKQTEIINRHKEGQSIKRITREMELSRNTVRQVIRKGGTRRYERKKQPITPITPYAEWAKRRFYEVEGNAALLYQELKERGYTGCYTAVKKLVRPMRNEPGQKATVRYETPPGQQAQVDWGSKTIMMGGERRRVHIFVMTLGYSRSLYAELTTNERLETLIACHENAFAWFGGVPEEILYDNPKTIVTNRSGETAELNPKFEDFSRYYGYTARLCRPYRAQTKGKVESGVKYVKRSYLPGKAFQKLSDGNEGLRRWIREVADERIHGTTFEKPSERMKCEKLTELGTRPPYVIKQPLFRKVSNDSMINLSTNRYSVPWQYIGQLLEVRKQDDRICAYKENRLVASHPAADQRHKVIAEPSHYQGLKVVNIRQAKRDIAPIPPEVEVRSLSVYAQLAAGGEYGG